MLGAAVPLANKLLSGRLRGTPWEHTVRKGLIIRMEGNSTILANQNVAASSLADYYGTALGKAGIIKRLGTAIKADFNEAKSMATSPFMGAAKGFKARYDALFMNNNGIGDMMLFMYNPTSWSRVTTAGIQQIDIPGNKPSFHQTHIPPQKFQISLLLDSSLWNNIDGVLSGLADSAIGLIPGIREAQFYQNIPGLDPFDDQYASLAPIIAWYEMLATPHPRTKRLPEVWITYQDMSAWCLVDSVTTEILRSDFRQNINRAMITLSFIVLYNSNLENDAGRVKSTVFSTGDGVVTREM